MCVTLGCTMLSRRELLMSPAAALQVRRKQPNVLFLVADEWRGQALPSAGDPDLVAPNLARLAREGADFRRAYTSYPVCCPSRAAMLTGRFPHSTGVTRNHTLLPLDQKTFSAELKNAGYRTGYIGKWHLDGNESPGFVPPARRRGFDFWAAYNVVHKHYDAVYFRDSPEPLSTPGFAPDHLTSLALDFIRAKTAQPFLLYLSWVAPHPPLTPPARHATYNPATLRLRPNVPADGQPEVRKKLAAYYGLCSAVDENVGRLLAELDRNGLSDDTIVVFTSDHGTTLGSHGIDEIDRPYEESAGIPLLIRYPGRVNAGLVNRMPVSNVDFAPTLLELCGVSIPRDMQGASFAKWLTGGKPQFRDAIYAMGAIGEPGEWRMVVRGSDKLVVDASLQPTHFFDLNKDPYEMNNLVAEQGIRRKRDHLLRLLRNWIPVG